MTDRVLGIVPFDRSLAQDRLFDVGGALDRDGSLAPWSALRNAAAAAGWRVATSDLVDRADVYLHLNPHGPVPGTSLDSTVLVLWEPEVVAPYWYDELRAGRGPKRSLVLDSQLARRPDATLTAFPHVPPAAALASEVSANRDLELVAIAGRKYPRRRTGELYTTRERLYVGLSRAGRLDLYGAGWGERDLRHPGSWLRAAPIGRAARGRVDNKLDVLKRARFSLCLENAVQPGYHSEKLFDAMAAGTVPIYLGDPTIGDWVPSDAFVQLPERPTTRHVIDILDTIDASAQGHIRAAGRTFFQSPAFDRYRIETFVRQVMEAIDEVCE